MRISSNTIGLVFQAQRLLYVSAEEFAKVANVILFVVRIAAHRNHGVLEWLVVVVARYGLVEDVLAQLNDFILLNTFFLTKR